MILVGLDGDEMGMIREVLAAEAVLPNASVAFAEALDAIARTRPDVVIVGYTNHIDNALALADAIRRDSDEITLVALAKQSDASAILAAMRMGFKEFVVLPEDATRLRQVVHDAAFRDSSDEDKGLVIAVTGAKGGVGTTVLATHLAAELAAIHRVLVVDMDFGMGDVASMMDLQTRDTLADLLPRADRLDERSLTASASVHRTKVHVLTTPEDMEALGPVRGDDIYSIISTAADAYQFVILDCGTYYDEAVTLALNVADTVVLVCTPDVTSVRDAFRRLKTMKTLGIDAKSRIRLVVNRWHKGAYVSLPDIQQNLGIPVSATVADDPRHVEQAINEGKLVREINKKSDVARDVASLVALLTQEADDTEPVREESNKGGGFFASLFGSRG